jgi:hypothetical protein
MTVVVGKDALGKGRLALKMVMAISLMIALILRETFA